jgi:hypothetical protein
VSWNIVLESSETLIRLFRFLVGPVLHRGSGRFFFSFFPRVSAHASTISVTLPNCHRNATYLDLG